MNILLLKGFNNYFNRIVKKHTTLAQYKAAATSYLEFTDINFNPNDGVATELILGSPSQQELSAPLAWDQVGTPDYLVCYETTNSTSTIKFRWFVLESERTRDGQYRLALKRDVIAENYDEIMSAPCYVEKGIVNNINNPLLKNTEGATVNQIKKNETPIVDESNSAWLVGYLKKNYNGHTTTDIMSADLNNIYSYDALFFKDCISFANGSQNPTKTLINDISSSSLSLYYSIRANATIPHYYLYSGGMVWGTWFNITAQGSQGNPNYGQTNASLIFASNNTGNSNWASWMNNATSGSNIPIATKANFINYLKGAVKSNNNLYESNDLSSGTTVAEIRAQYNGAIINKDGRFYKLSFTNNGSTTASGTFNAGSSASIGAYMSYVVSALNTGAGGNTTFSYNSATSGNTLQANLDYSAVTILATEIGTTENAITLEIPSSEQRITCDDALYDIFAVPYIPTQYREDYQGAFTYSGTNYTLDSDACLFITQRLMTEIGIGDAGANAYDLQLLPYCPIKLPMNAAGTRVQLSQLATDSYRLITKHVVDPSTSAESDVPIGYVLFPSSVNFSKNVDITRSINTSNMSAPLAAKLSNECDFLRLTAPNFNSVYEFKLSKLLDGQMHYINIDCTYRPINPYIKMNPDFTGLYGQDFNDSTGLLFNGDFSLATLTDPWITYEHNNKNYQAIFNRQIQSMDISQQLAREQMNFQNLVGGVTAPITGAAGGALAGGKVGGAPGAIAGAAVGVVGGTALGIAGGIKNNEWLARQQSEAKSYAIDMYNYQLGNIQALPQSLTKGDPITYNNKVWPILEEFSCSDEEKEVLKDKIRYNSMTIMAIGTLSEYASSTDFNDVYVKGQLIRLTDVKDDFHVIDAIYQEVDKGFYIPQ